MGNIWCIPPCNLFWCLPIELGVCTDIMYITEILVAKIPKIGGRARAIHEYCTMFLEVLDTMEFSRVLPRAVRLSELISDDKVTVNLLDTGTVFRLSIVAAKGVGNPILSDKIHIGVWEVGFSFHPFYMEFPRSAAVEYLSTVIAFKRSYTGKIGVSGNYFIKAAATEHLKT